MFFFFFASSLFNRHIFLPLCSIAVYGVEICDQNEIQNSFHVVFLGVDTVIEDQWRTKERRDESG